MRDTTGSIGHVWLAGVPEMQARLPGRSSRRGALALLATPVDVILITKVNRMVSDTASPEPGCIKVAGSGAASVRAASSNNVEGVWMNMTRKAGRRPLRWIAVGCGLMLLAGCSQQPAAAVATPPSEGAAAPAAMAAPADSAPAPDTAPAAAAPVALTEGMAYADLRAAVLAKGWKPKVDAQCKANVVGGNFAEVCKDHPDQCKVCDDAPELSSCSGDGHCLMNFERGAGEALAVSTYGEIADWNVTGASSRLTVKWWDPESIEAPATK
ncbi:MAG: hypothetical protein ABWX87_04435 [Pseudoxanthomonas sp.]